MKSTLVIALSYNLMIRVYNGIYFVKNNGLMSPIDGTYEFTLISR